MVLPLIVGLPPQTLCCNTFGPEVGGILSTHSTQSTRVLIYLSKRKPVSEEVIVSCDEVDNETQVVSTESPYLW